MVHVLVPYAGGNFLHLTDDQDERLKTDELLERLLALEPDTVIGTLGGGGNAVFTLLARHGWETRRVPWHTLQEVLGVPGGIAGADEKQRGLWLEEAWGQNPGVFYPTQNVDERIYIIRELTRTRLNIQEFRKQAGNQYQAAYRDLAPLLPEEGRLARIRTTYATPAMVAGAKQDEKELEAQVTALVKGLPIWDALHPGPSSLLPSVKGLGPSIGGSIIGEIGDIRRFSSREKLRAYARLHVSSDGAFPKRKRGEVSNWNNSLHRAMWLWFSDQVARYDHVWRQLYYWRKATLLQRYPEPIPVPKADGNGAVLMHTLGHLDRQARRWIGSKLCNYIFDLWSAMAAGRDAEEWYVYSNWPGYFSAAEAELDQGLQSWLTTEIGRRRGGRGESLTDKEE